MKYCIAFACLFAFLLACTGCPGHSMQSTGASHNETAAIYPSPNNNASPSLQAYCAPWTGDVSADAIADGKLHYYFMSGKGMSTNYEKSDPFKWGDSTLIVFPDGQTMLIDVGAEAYAPVLAANLKQMGVRRVDYLMVSHPHGDHFGGIIAENSFLDMISVDTVLYNGVDRGEKSDLFYTRCADRSIPVRIVKQGDVLEFGDVCMEILWPLEGTAGEVITRTEAINNRSIVARFDFGDHSSLFVGDLYASGEALVINACAGKLDVDLLKVPHHGYGTSSSRLFVYTVSPELAVAMSGFKYAVQLAYESNGATFLYDRYEGYIHVMTDGTTMTYDTERSR